MSESFQLIDLVRDALRDLDDPTLPLSTTVDKAIRVARLTNDHQAVYWLRLETHRFTKETHDALKQDLKMNLADDEFRNASKQLGMRYVRDRSVQLINVNDYGELETITNQMLSIGLRELESSKDQINMKLSSLTIPSGIDQHNIRDLIQSNNVSRTILLHERGQIDSILSRIRNRVHEYLVNVESSLTLENSEAEFLQTVSDVFERNRVYVESRLAIIAPDVLQKFTVAVRRMLEGDVEARSHALESCRRLLKSLADSVYPATDGAITDGSGKSRQLTEDKYRNRLWQFVSDKMGKHTSGELLLAGIDDIGNRIDGLYDLSCKGVHGEVSEFEVNQCVTQTWILIGDIIHLAEVGHNQPQGR